MSDDSIVKVTPSDLYKFALRARSNTTLNRELETAKQLLPAISATGLTFFIRYVFGSARVAVKSKKALLETLRLFGKSVSKNLVLRTVAKTAVKTAVGAVLGSVVNPWIGVCFLALTAADVFNTLSEVRIERQAYDKLLEQASKMDSAALMFGSHYVNARVWEILTLAAALPARQALALCSRISARFNDGDSVKEVNLADPEDLNDFLFTWVTLEQVDKRVSSLITLTHDLNQTQSWMSIWIQTVVIFFTMVSGSKLVAVLSSTRKAVLLAGTGAYGHFAVCAPDVENFFMEVDDDHFYAINWTALYEAYETSKDVAQHIDKYAAPYLKEKSDEFQRLNGMSDWSNDTLTAKENEALNGFMSRDTLQVLKDAATPGAADIVTEMTQDRSRLSVDSLIALQSAVYDSLGGELPAHNSFIVDDGDIHTFEEEYK